MCVCVYTSPRSGAPLDPSAPLHPGDPLHPGAPRRAPPGPRHAMIRCAALALLCAAIAHADQEKRAEMSPVPFVMGSRYGRSPGRVMTPRNDRFFMGSRYGKRSDYLPIEEATRVLPSREDHDRAECQGEQCARRLVCEYTGVLSLFKCVRGHTHLEFARRSNDDTGPGEEV